MSTNRISDADLAGMLRARADRVAPPEIVDLVMGAVARERVAGTGPRSRRRSSRGIVLLIAATLLVGASLATFLVTGRSRPTPAITAPVDFGIFAPVAGRIVYGDGQFGVGVEMVGVDPEAPTEPQTRVRLAAEPSTPLGWSNDGSKLLLIRGPETSANQRGLFVLHADGSETPVTDRPMAIRGAAISPDGSQVVFGADGALWTVDADGGPAKLLVDGRNGFVEDPAFSPDGTKIAYDDGVGDNGHRIWVVDADGRNAHDITPDGFGDCACHVYGIAWSPIEDRIAVGLEGTTYTFATDGSDLTPVINNGDHPRWSPDGSQIAYTTTCLQDPSGCGLGIANADGSEPRGVGRAMAGPWHPGTHE